MQDKILIIIVTRNNHVLLSNLISSMEKYPAGYDYDVVIADNTSTDPKQLLTLEKLSKKYNIITCENDRVEVTFDFVSQKYIDQYKYFLFLHDDIVAIKENWLGVYIERLKSNYCEGSIKQAHYSKYQIGRVSACHQPYRDYTSCLGFPLQSIFLKKALEVYGQDILIYKYSDIDRTLYTEKCLRKTGIWNLKSFKDTKESYIYKKLTAALNSTLTYPDEGMTPRNKYPAGECWNKLTLLSEFFNCVWPLIEGYRTVGLVGDGDLEQVVGYDTPFGNEYLVHWGAPHTKRWLGKKFGCTSEEIHKKIYENNLPFMMKCTTMMKEHFK